jgi:hypothetical protein
VKSRLAGEVVVCVIASAIRCNRVTLALDRGHQCVVTDQGVIEVHAYSLGGYVDNGRVYAIERVERFLEGGLASRA